MAYRTLSSSLMYVKLEAEVQERQNIFKGKLTFTSTQSFQKVFKSPDLKHGQPMTVRQMRTSHVNSKDVGAKGERGCVTFDLLDQDF